MHYRHPIIHSQLGREQVRAVDQKAIQDYGITGLVLMENAGSGVAQILNDLSPPKNAVILCGKGNNAGDGFVIARHLENTGWTVNVLMLYPPEQLAGDALANWQILSRSEIPWEFIAETSIHELPQQLCSYSVILDCLLGTGASGDPRSPLAEAIIAANQTEALRVAVDLPSGLDCDSGKVGTPCFRADHTCTFVAPKPGFFVKDAKPYLGQIHTVSIGVPNRLLDEAMREGQ